MRRSALLVLVSWLFAPAVVWAVIETYQFSSPDLEVRYHTLSQELRCPKCQNQNIEQRKGIYIGSFHFHLY